LPSANGTLALTSDIPSLTGYVPTSRTLTINGTTYDLSADRSWTITSSGGTVTSVAALTLGTTGTDLSSSVATGTTTPVITLNVPTASATNRGALSSADWTTFNNKLSSSTAATTYVPYTGANTNVTLGAYSLTATSLIKSGGTSAQILAADGSVITAGTNITISGGTISSTAGGIGGSGTTNYYAKFTASGTIGNSGVYEGTSGYVSIGNTNSTYNLDVTGTGRFTGALSGTSATFSGTFEAGRTGGAVTAGDLSVDTTSTSAKVIIGRLSSTGSDNTTLIGRNRVGVQGWSIDSFGAASFGSTLAVTGAATFSSSVTAGTTSSGANINAYVSSYGSNGLFQSFGTDGNLKLQMGGLGTNEAFIYTGSGNKLSIFTGGSTSMTITSTGNVGIGTTSPGSKLQVEGGEIRATTSNAGIAMYYSASNGEIAAYNWGGSAYLNLNLVGLSHTFSTSGTERMRITSGGNVGIGTTSPNGGLSIVAPSSSTALSLWGRSGDNFSAIRFQSNTGASTYATIYSNSSDLILENGGSERMRITSDGIIQISTTSSIPTTNNSIYSYSGNGYLYIQGGSTGAALAGSGDRNNAVYVNTSINSILFHTNGAGERMRITSGGNVLVGTTSAIGFALEVNGSIWTQKLRVNDGASGYVTLEMENTTRWRINYLGRFSGYGAGALTTDASGNITASSDRTLKDIIRPVENVLENIMDFEPVYFKWNDKTDLDKENIYMSTIAQSIQKHYPDAVGKMADGTLTVQDRAVTAILVQAIKELKAELDLLKKQ
jgi:hypothetical protein